MPMIPRRDNRYVAAMLSSPRTGMKAEARVYASLEKVFAHDPDVDCLWSLALPDSPRELDFLVVHRTLGIAALEVKSIPIIPTKTNWKQIDPATGQTWDSNRQAPERQLGAAMSALKKWWKMESGGRTSTPRNIQVLILTGIRASDIPDNSGLALARTLWRQKSGVYIVCGDETDHLPYLLLDRLKAQTPDEKSRTAAAAFFEAAQSLHGSCGVSPSLESDPAPAPKSPSAAAPPPRQPEPATAEQKAPPENKTVSTDDWLTWENAGKAVAAATGAALAIAGITILMKKD